MGIDRLFRVRSKISKLSIKYVHQKDVEFLVALIVLDIYKAVPAMRKARTHLAL